MIFDAVIPFVSALATWAATRFLGARKVAKVRKVATTILESPANPITSSREAIEAAILAAHQLQIARDASRLDALIAEGKVRVAAAEARGRANAALVTIDRTAP